MLIVESIGDKKRMPAYAKDKVISLADVAIYTEEEEKPLWEVFEAIKTKEANKEVTVNLKDNDALRAYFGEVLPTFDKERVHTSDIKKVLQWYNILVADGETDFTVKEEVQGEAEAGTKVDVAEKKAEAKAAAKPVKATRAAAPKRTATVRKAGGN